MAFNLFEHGRLAASHIRFNGLTIKGLLYTDGFPRLLGLGLVKRLKLLSALIACFL
jgi:hypothetical protein